MKSIQISSASRDWARKDKKLCLGLKINEIRECVGERKKKKVTDGERGLEDD